MPEDAPGVPDYNGNHHYRKHENGEEKTFASNFLHQEEREPQPEEKLEGHACRHDDPRGPHRSPVLDARQYITVIRKPDERTPRDFRFPAYQADADRKKQGKDAYDEHEND